MNNYYSQPYYYPQTSPMPAVAANTRPNGIIWVNGEDGARAYAMAPNSNVMLLDAENEGRFYIKTSDNIGMCTIRTFEYKEVIDVQPVMHHTDVQVEYATKQDIEELRAMINSMKGGNHEQSLQSAQYSKPKTYGSNSSRD